MHDHDDLPALREQVRALQAQLSTHERARRSRRWLWLTGLALLSATAWAQLVTFAPDAPARADEVNQNFQQLKTWLEAKVGTVGQPVSITMGLPGTQIADNSVASVDLQDNTVASSDILDGTVANVDLAPELRCPDGSRQSFGQCIFYRPTGPSPYQYTFRQAANACLQDGARLCTEAEVSAAHAAGMQLCAFGWFADRVNDTFARRGYPMQSVTSGCGTNGINAGSADMGTLFGAWCCKN